MASTSVSAVVFYVQHLARTRSFYEDVLGLTLQTQEGHHGTFMTTQAGETTLIFIEQDEPAGRTPVIVFGLDGGIEEIVEGMVEQGVEIVAPVSEAPDGGLTADFLDPDGHVLSFYQPAEAPRRKNDDER